MVSYGKLYEKRASVNKRLSFADMRRLAKEPAYFLRELAQDGRRMVKIRFVGKTYFVLQHPDLIKQILVDNHKGYYKPGATKLLRLFLGEGLSTSNGELWLRQRRNIQPAFHKQRLQKLLDVINEEVISFTNKLKTVASGKVINFSNEFSQLTLSIVSRALLSNIIDGEMQTLVNTLKALAEYAANWMRSFIKIPMSWPTRANIQFKKNCKIIDDIIFDLIERRKACNADRTCPQKGDLLDMLLGYSENEEGEKMPAKLLRDEVITIIMAGYETTSLSLSWILYHIGKDKQIQQKLRDEAFKIIGKELPTSENLFQLVYTKQVINEGLRMYPPIWAIVRKPYKKDVIDDVTIPASANVLLNVYGMHHHPGYWLAPEDFNPEHFADEAEKQRQHFAFLPFGGGPRLCIGNSFAMMIMQVVLSKMVQCFQIDISPSNVPAIETNISLRAKGGIELLIRKCHE